MIRYLLVAHVAGGETWEKLVTDAMEVPSSGERMLLDIGGPLVDVVEKFHHIEFVPVVVCSLFTRPDREGWPKVLRAAKFVEARKYTKSIIAGL